MESIQEIDTNYWSSQKKDILQFCDGKLVQFAYAPEKYSRRIFLTPTFFDKYIPKKPVALHYTVEHFALAPFDREFVDGIDYLLDIDGSSFAENANIMTVIVKYFEHEFDMDHFDIIQTNGTHDGFQIRIPYQAFMDKNPVTRYDLYLLRKFYVISHWFLNHIILKKPDLLQYTIELKNGAVLGRAPFGWHERTGRKIRWLRKGITAHLEGETYLDFIMKQIYDTFKDKIHRDVKIPIFFVTRKNTKKYNQQKKYVAIQQFPPCFKIGIWKLVQEGVNQEMVIFALWNFLYYSGWNQEDILSFIWDWFEKKGLKADMKPIVEKHKGRKFSMRISCEYLKNKARICMDCNRGSPFQEGA